MLLRNPSYPDHNRICNNRNLHEYAPYIITDNGNVIDTEWWKSLSGYCQELIIERTNNNFSIKKISMPHNFQFDNKEKFLSTVYRCYLDSFDYHRWHNPNLINGPKNVSLVPITTQLKEIMLDIYASQKSYCDYIKDIKVENIEILKSFEKEINKVLEANPNTEYFIRLSSTSGKNEKSVEPFSTSLDIISHISSVKLFVDQEFKRFEKDTYLIIMPWNNNIEPRSEFRIFVVNDKLTAVSQQNRHDLYQYSKKELKIIEHALNDITFLTNTPYGTFVGDVYIDLESKTCKLIELNPFGAHSGAGASLFNWIDDYDILHGNSQPEFRYLSIIAF
jgi:hypothetical protein